MAALKEFRRKSGYSGREVSAKLRRVYNYVSKLETGQRVPNYCEVMHYLDAIDADPVEFARRVRELSGPRRRKRSVL
jgi:transcriptional regulator with XRE-family HTH domain